MLNDEQKPRENITGLSPMPLQKDQKTTRAKKVKAYEELAAFLLKQYRKNVLQK